MATTSTRAEAASAAERRRQARARAARRGGGGSSGPGPLDDGATFYVERLLAERERVGRGGVRRTQFLIRWRGYGEEDDTWEDAENVYDDRLVAQFRARSAAARLAAAEAKAGGETTPTPDGGAASTWTCRLCRALLGSAVFAPTADGGYARATVLLRDAHGKLGVRFGDAVAVADAVNDAREGRTRTQPRRAAGLVASAAARKMSREEDGEGEGSPTLSDVKADPEADAFADAFAGAVADAVAGAVADSTAVCWVAERDVAVAEPDVVGALRGGMRVLCRWVDGRRYAGTLVGGAKGGLLSVDLGDGLRYEAPPDAILPFLHASTGEHSRIALVLEASTSRRAQAARAAAPDRAPRLAEPGVVSHGPLRRALDELRAVWRREIRKRGAVEEQLQGVDGLYVCRDFLSDDEVRCLRLVFAAHSDWTMYHWGSVGKKGELASVLKRIDWGNEEMTAEGVAAARSLTRPLRDAQKELVALFEGRLRAVFGKCADLWPDGEGANMLQFSQIPAGQCLGDHFDRRDKWREGIVSVAWSAETGASGDVRGDPWTLRMQMGPKNNIQKERTIEMPAGCAYVICREAQARAAPGPSPRVAPARPVPRGPLRDPAWSPRFSGRRGARRIAGASAWRTNRARAAGCTGSGTICRTICASR